MILINASKIKGIRNNHKPALCEVIMMMMIIIIIMIIIMKIIIIIIKIIF